MHASQEGNALAVCSQLGLAGDRRPPALAETLLESQWPDGGWNCDVAPTASHASFHESITPLWGLVEYADATGDVEARAAADRASELFLSHELFRSRSSGLPVHPEWLRFHHPPYWHYDVLHGSR